MLPARASASGVSAWVPLDGIALSVVCVVASLEGARAAVAPGLETVEVHDVAAMAESTMTHATVLARRA